MPPYLRLALVCLTVLLLGCQGGDSSAPDTAPAPPLYTAPTFTRMPANLTVDPGQPATFTCQATGTGPITYQWNLGGVPIQGAQGDSYTEPAVAVNEDGEIFTVTASGPGGRVISPPASLHVNVQLATLTVQSLALALPDGPELRPGQSLPMVITATLPGGVTLATAGKGGGPVAWSQFSLQPTTVTVDPSGNVALPADPRVSDGLLPHVQAVVTSQPTLTASLDIPIRYDGAFLLDASGSQGAPGSDGLAGYPGSPGGSGSCDPDFPMAGGNGGDGGDGGAGGDGGPGGDGGAIQAWVTLHPGPKVLLEVKATGPSGTQFFLVDPAGGTLLLNCDGGSGGMGGNGGAGGSGGSGGSGCPDGMSGNSGMNGPSGSSGTDGTGGTLTVHIDPSAVAYQSVLKLSNQGMPSGPAPTILIQPVAPLW